MAAPGKPTLRAYSHTHERPVHAFATATTTPAAIQVPEGWVFFGDHAKQNISSRYDHPNKTVLIAKDSDAFVPPYDFVNIWHQARGNYERSRHYERSCI